MAAAPSNGAAPSSSSEAEAPSAVPTGAGSPTAMSNNHAMINPGEFFQPLVKHRLNRSQATARPQRPRVHIAEPYQTAQ